MNIRSLKVGQNKITLSWSRTLGYELLRTHCGNRVEKLTEARRENAMTIWNQWRREIGV